MNYIKLIYYLIAILPSCLIAQSNSYLKLDHIPPKPKTNLDSLIQAIIYPDLYRLAKIEFFLRVDLKIDTLGNVESINTKYTRPEGAWPDSAFIRLISDQIKRSEWYPALRKSKKIVGKTSIPILFYVSAPHIGSSSLILKHSFGPRISPDVP